MSSEFIVKLNKDTSWTVTRKDGKLSRKLWSKREVEDFLDMQENLTRKNKGKNFFKIIWS